jgi:hypothetical protein
MGDFRFKDTRVVDALIGCLQDQSMEVRQLAAQKLGRVGDGRAVEPLIACLQQNARDSDVGASAAVALGELKDKRAAESLMDCLRNDMAGPEVRAAAAVALGQIRDGRAFDVLLKCCNDRHAEVSSSAIRALGEMLPGLKDEEPMRRTTALRTLMAILRTGGNDPRVNGAALNVLQQNTSSDEFMALQRDGIERKTGTATQAEMPPARHTQRPIGKGGTGAQAGTPGGTEPQGIGDDKASKQLSEPSAQDKPRPAVTPVKSDPESQERRADSYFKMALQMIASGRTDKAISYLEKIQAELPETPTAAKAKAKLAELRKGQ